MAGPAHLPGRFGRTRPGFVSLIAVVVFASVVAAAGPAEATVSGQDGRIAYVTEVDGDMEIYSVNPDGSDPVNLTNAHTTPSGPIDDHDPAWSPDGRRIAFTRSVMDPDADEPEIVPSLWIMDADGSNQELVEQYAHSPTWSPDGTKIAYIAHAPGPGGDDLGIRVIDLATGLLGGLTDEGAEPVWSPDGSTIYYVVSFCPATPISCYSDVMAVDVASGSAATVFADPARWIPSMDISPDGQWLVSSERSFLPGPVDRVALRSLVDGAETFPLAENTLAIGSGFAPSGERIAVGRTDVPMTPPTQVWTMDVDGTDLEYVVDGWDPAWQPVNPYPFGLVDPDQGEWHLRHVDGSVESFYFGNPGDVPFMGDWDCDGIDTPGLYRQSDGYVYLRNSNTQGIADVSFFFGNPGDVPIAGDFDGDGCSTVSVYRPSNQTFYIINELGDGDAGLGAAETSYVFGDPGDKPFVGDFDGDGIDTVGLHRESTGLVYYRNTHTQGIADGQFIFGDPGDRLVAFDWNDDGMDAPGLFRPGTTTVYLRFTNTQGVADAWFMMGKNDWLPVVGTFE